MAADLTVEQLQKIRARCEAASPGPWQAAPWNSQPNGYLHGPLPPHLNESIPAGLLKATAPCSLRWEDCDFVAHARDDVPALAAEIERLRGLILRAARGDPDDLWAEAERLEAERGG